MPHPRPSLDALAAELELKTRHVRTQEGSQRYKLPIGAPITRAAIEAARARNGGSGHGSSSSNGGGGSNRPSGRNRSGRSIASEGDRSGANAPRTPGSIVLRRGESVSLVTGKITRSDGSTRTTHAPTRDAPSATVHNESGTTRVVPRQASRDASVAGREPRVSPSTARRSEPVDNVKGKNGETLQAGHEVTYQGKKRKIVQVRKGANDNPDMVIFEPLAGNGGNGRITEARADRVERPADTSDASDGASTPNRVRRDRSGRGLTPPSDSSSSDSGSDSSSSSTTRPSGRDRSGRGLTPPAEGDANSTTVPRQRSSRARGNAFGGGTPQPAQDDSTATPAGNQSNSNRNGQQRQAGGGGKPGLFGGLIALIQAIIRLIQARQNRNQGTDSSSTQGTSNTASVEFDLALKTLASDHGFALGVVRELARLEMEEKAGKAKKFDVHKHPRDKHGKFIKTGQQVDLGDGHTGTVTAVQKNGNVIVKDNGTGADTSHTSTDLAVSNDKANAPKSKANKQEIGVGSQVTKPDGSIGEVSAIALSPSGHHSILVSDANNTGAIFDNDPSNDFHPASELVPSITNGNGDIFAVGDRVKTQNGAYGTVKSVHPEDGIARVAVDGSKWTRVKYKVDKLSPSDDNDPNHAPGSQASTAPDDAPQAPTPAPADDPTSPAFDMGVPVPDYTAANHPDLKGKNGHQAQAGDQYLVGDGPAGPNLVTIDKVWIDSHGDAKMKVHSDELPDGMTIGAGVIIPKHDVYTPGGADDTYGDPTPVSSLNPGDKITIPTLGSDQGKIGTVVSQQSGEFGYHEVSYTVDEDGHAGTASFVGPQSNVNVIQKATPNAGLMAETGDHIEYQAPDGTKLSGTIVGSNAAGLQVQHDGTGDIGIIKPSQITQNGGSIPQDNPQKAQAGDHVEFETNDGEIVSGLVLVTGENNATVMHDGTGTVETVQQHQIGKITPQAPAPDSTPAPTQHTFKAGEHVYYDKPSTGEGTAGTISSVSTPGYSGTPFAYITEDGTGETHAIELTNLHPDPAPDVPAEGPVSGPVLGHINGHEVHVGDQITAQDAFQNTPTVATVTGVHTASGDSTPSGYNVTMANGSSYFYDDGEIQEINGTSVSEPPGGGGKPVLATVQGHPIHEGDTVMGTDFGGEKSITVTHVDEGGDIHGTDADGSSYFWHEGEVTHVNGTPVSEPYTGASAPAFTPAKGQHVSFTGMDDAEHTGTITDTFSGAGGGSGWQIQSDTDGLTHLVYPQAIHGPAAASSDQAAAPAPGKTVDDLKVGDSVAWEKNGVPNYGKVVKVTPAGNFRVEDSNGVQHPIKKTDVTNANNPTGPTPKYSPTGVKSVQVGDVVRKPKGGVAWKDDNGNVVNVPDGAKVTSKHHAGYDQHGGAFYKVSFDTGQSVILRHNQKLDVAEDPSSVPSPKTNTPAAPKKAAPEAPSLPDPNEPVVATQDIEEDSMNTATSLPKGQDYQERGSDDLAVGDIILADGRDHFVTAIQPTTDGGKAIRLAPTTSSPKELADHRRDLTGTNTVVLPAGTSTQFAARTKISPDIPEGGAARDVHPGTPVETVTYTGPDGEQHAFPHQMKPADQLVEGDTVLINGQEAKGPLVVTKLDVDSVHNSKNTKGVYGRWNGQGDEVQVFLASQGRESRLLVDSEGGLPELPPASKLPGNGPTGKFSAHFDEKTRVAGEKYSRKAGSYVHPLAKKQAGHVAGTGHVQQAKANIAAELASRLNNEEDWKEFQAYRKATGGSYGSTLADYQSLNSAQRHDILAAEVSTRIQQWAGTSGDSDPESQSMQKAVQEEFGLDDTWSKSMTSNSSVKSQVNGSFYDQRSAFYRRLARVQYEHTQEDLAAEGITEISLYRGMRLTTAQASWAKHNTVQDNIELSPVNSFATDLTTAKFFSSPTGGIIIKTTVPASQILGSCKTGFGCYGEFEFAVMNSDGSAEIKPYQIGY